MKALDEFIAYFGKQHVDYILQLPYPSGFCRGRATGCWDANLLRDETMYRKLAKVLENPQ